MQTTFFRILKPITRFCISIFMFYLNFCRERFSIDFNRSFWPNTETPDINSFSTSQNYGNGKKMWCRKWEKKNVTINPTTLTFKYLNKSWYNWQEKKFNNFSYVSLIISKMVHNVIYHLLHYIPRSTFTHTFTKITFTYLTKLKLFRQNSTISLKAIFHATASNDTHQFNWKWFLPFLFDSRIAFINIFSKTNLPFTLKNSLFQYPVNSFNYKFSREKNEKKRRNR